MYLFTNKTKLFGNNQIFLRNFKLINILKYFFKKYSIDVTNFEVINYSKFIGSDYLDLTRSKAVKQILSLKIFLSLRMLSLIFYEQLRLGTYF